MRQQCLPEAGDLPPPLSQWPGNPAGVQVPVSCLLLREVSMRDWAHFPRETEARTELGRSSPQAEALGPCLMLWDQ